MRQMNYLFSREYRYFESSSFSKKFGFIRHGKINNTGQNG